MPRDAVDLLADLTDDQRAQIDAFAALMLKWNQKINVTAAKSIADVLAHCVDGIVAAKLIPAGAGTLVDIGSGGGLPLIPMAIMRPEVAMTGVEPIAKKWAFLVSCSRELGLKNVSARQGRVEELFDGNKYDVATSKATFELTRWLEIGLRLVKPNGAVLSFGSAAATPTSASPADVFDFVRDGASYWISRHWRVP